MVENRNGCNSQNGRDRDMVCIDTYRVLDSCRDKDCFENVRVYLTCCGQDIIQHTNVVRSKHTKVLWAYIDTDPVPFNRGFYQLTIKIYVKILFEACLGPGNVQEFEGVAVVEKKVILFGSEGNVSVFKSETQQGGYCSCNTGCRQSRGNNLPVAVLETVDPIVLDVKVAEPRQRCCCCCALDEIPDSVAGCFQEDLVDNDEYNKLLVSIGFFTVVRIERPAQYLINAVEYCVPEKECTMPPPEDPCSLFRNMAFPVNEFCPPSVLPGNNGDSDGKGKCGCGG
ncbi:MAG: hypothetical protein IKY52_04240 [Clostridia bacterium]|nr:hypothetical protein [Clostridia bacterium]